MDIVSIVISTTLELSTLENGAIRIIYPTLLTPVVTGQMALSKSDTGTKSEENGYLRQMRSRRLATVVLFNYCSSLILEVAGQNIVKLLCICSPAQSHQLFWCHLRKTRPASGLWAAVHSLHLQQSRRQPSTL